MSHDGGESIDVQDPYCVQDRFLNYTQVKTLYGEKFNLAPRFHECGVHLSGAEYVEMGITFWDTQREKDIKLGISYPFEPLGPGECIVAFEGASIGDTVIVENILYEKASQTCIWIVIDKSKS